jgi:O-antigen biosynthesis protein WbqP
MGKRLFDLVVGSVGFIAWLVPGLLIWAIIRATSRGPAIYWSDRIGRHSRLFKMAKFRTMRVDTPAVATHLLVDANRYVTPIGSYLRITSLDELPQLWNVLKGDMSLVGPRPALFNQDDLITMRKQRGIDKLRPGLTGWAQINGRDDLSIENKVNLDLEYLKCRSFLFDLRILSATISHVVRGKGVSH